MGYIKAEGIGLIPKVSNLFVNLRNRRNNCNFVLQVYPGLNIRLTFLFFIGDHLIKQ
jgi:hypothetical protein